MLYQDDDGIKKGGIDIEDLDDDELIEKATNNDEEQEEETPEESSTEKKTEDEDESEGDETESEDEEDKQVPFHKHPRFRELTKTNRDTKEALEEATKKIDELTKSIKEPKEDNKIAPWFVELYGDNQEAWDIYSKQSKNDKAQMKQEIVEELGEQAKEPAKQEEKMNEWVQDEVTRLIDDGNKFDKNKLLKVMVDYKPTDDDGNLDFDKGLKLYQKFNNDVKKDTTKTKIKKKIADITTSSNKTIKTEPKYMTSQHLRYRSMQSLAEDE